MVYLFVSILFSVSVGILFKFIKARTTINIFLIAVNYLCAIAATWIFFRPQIQLRAIPFNIYNLSLSILLPLVFILLSLSIRYSGIMKTDIAQRISLVIPIACSYWVFNETIPILRWLGIVIGFIAMFFILNKAQHSPEKNALYLLLVFFGYGIIDVLFKMVALQKSVPYTTALFYIFCGSFIVAAAITLFAFVKNKIVITTGILLRTTAWPIQFFEHLFLPGGTPIFFRKSYNGVCHDELRCNSVGHSGRGGLF